MSVMELDENLYRTFLEEMSALENFRMNYAAAHPRAPLEPDDPDVKRMMEALALFSARTRIAALDNIVACRLRLFQQFFPYLLSPMPSLGMLQARLTGQFAETALLPKGSEIAVSVKSGDTALFRTLHDLSLSPVTLVDLKMLLLPNKGFRLVLQFETPYPRNDEIGTLSFLIDHLRDFKASLRVFHALESHLTRASILFDEKATETSKGQPCDFSFGAAPEGEKHNPDTEQSHPLEVERLFFHYPEQELYLNIATPEPPRNWRRFTLCLDLDSRWPRNLVVNKDVFQLFTVPIINLRRGMAHPIVCDGTRERFPIGHPMLEYRFQLHSVLGVYEASKEGMRPIRAGILSGGKGSYELERLRDERGGERPYLTLHFPDAFENPRTVTVDALWLQPWFSETSGQRRYVAPYSRNIPGIKWELLGEVAPHTENRFSDNTEGFMQLLTLSNKHVMGFEDLQSLLRILGGVANGRFKNAFDLLADSKVEETPLRRNDSAGMLKHLYRLYFKAFDSSMRPQVEILADRIGRILNIWIAHAVVEVRIEMVKAEPSAEKSSA